MPQYNPNNHLHWEVDNFVHYVLDCLLASKIEQLQTPHLLDKVENFFGLDIGPQPFFVRACILKK